MENNLKKTRWNIPCGCACDISESGDVISVFRICENHKVLPDEKKCIDLAIAENRIETAQNNADEIIDGNGL